jgi:hypothetical protein
LALQQLNVAIDGVLHIQNTPVQHVGTKAIATTILRQTAFEHCNSFAHRPEGTFSKQNDVYRKKHQATGRNTSAHSCMNACSVLNESPPVPAVVGAPMRSQGQLDVADLLSSTQDRDF